MDSFKLIPVCDIIKTIQDNDSKKFKSFLCTCQSHLDSIIDPNGQTMLHYAVMSSPDIVKDLLDYGADPDSMDSEEKTPLILAAKDGLADSCELILKHGAQINHKDINGWTALMWASYKGNEDVVKVLLKYHADPQLRQEHGMTPLIWAAGRGHANIVEDLINAGAKVQMVDKFSSSALLWACRKGYKDCAIHLINAGAALDTVGMNGWTPLLAAARGGYIKLVNLLLQYNPNLNHKDKDGMTAIALASQKGYDDIVAALLAKGANGTLPNLLNDTPLILACKNGHYAVAKTLLSNNIGTNAQGHNSKTALYHAVDKNYNDIVLLLLRNRSDTEISSDGGETPLHRAIHNRNTVAVQMLLDAGANVAKPDNKGDTALHVAVRMRSKHLTEMLLRNPRNSKILYLPNGNGQTPYTIDAQSGHPYLPYLFGAQHLKSFDYTENMLGYDLYSSALADVFCDPMLGLPLTVGLYAKWGSGKSFLLKKLQDEMKSFTYHQPTPTFKLTAFVSFITMLFCLFIIVFVAIAWSWEFGLILFIGLSAIFYTFYGFIILSNYFNWTQFAVISEFMADKFNKLKLFFQIIYCNPFSRGSDDVIPIGVRFLFTDYMKLTIMGGEMSIAGMVATLCQAAENEFGLLTVRFYRVFHPKINDKRRTKTCFFIPKYLVTIVTALCFVSLAALSVKYFLLKKGTHPITPNSLAFKIMIGLACVVLLAFIANIPVWKRLTQYSFTSQAHRVLHSADNLDKNNAEGFMQKIKSEVNHLVDLVKTIDIFTNRHTRLVIIIDGLDSCEQEKILQILEAVKTLFSETKAPFITILAIDPHIIIRAIESNLNLAFQKSSIKGNEYLRNTVNLPIFLQRQGLLQFCAGKNANLRVRNIYKKQSLMYSSNLGLSTSSIKGVGVKPKSTAANLAVSNAQLNQPLSINVGNVLYPNGPRASFTESVSSNLAPADKSVAFKGSSMFALTNAENMDLRKIFTNDHYFSDINPRSLRRLTNIVYVSGRLMKAFSLDFQWVRLATWINLIEQWPYRLSWIILYYEENESWLADNNNNNITLKHIYDIVLPFVPTSREIEPFLEYDKNDLKLVYMLSGSTVKLTIGDMKLFLPFSVNLDPYIKKVIREHIGDLLKCKPTNLTHQGYLPEVFKDCESIQIPTQSAARLSPIARPNQFYETSNLPTPGAMSLQDMGILQTEEAKAKSLSLLYASGSPMFKKIEINKAPALLSCQEIADLIVNIPDWSSQADLDKYRQNIIDNNLNGYVILTCDKIDLQQVLPMKFGDWHIFLGFISYLRYLISLSTLNTTEKMVEKHKHPIEKYFDEKTSPSTYPKQVADMSHLEKEVEQEHEILSAAISKFDENDLKISESDGEECEDDKAKESVLTGTLPNITFNPRGLKSFPYQKLKNITRLTLSQQPSIKEGEILDTSNPNALQPSMATETRVKKKSNNRLFDKGSHSLEFLTGSPPASENYPLLNYEQKQSDETFLNNQEYQRGNEATFIIGEDFYGAQDNRPDEMSSNSNSGHVTPLATSNTRARPSPKPGNAHRSSTISTQLQNVHDILENTMKRQDSQVSRITPGINKNFIVTSVTEPISDDLRNSANSDNLGHVRSRKLSEDEIVQAKENDLKEQEENVRRKIEINETRPDYASLDYCPHSVMKLERKSSRIKEGLEKLAAHRRSSTSLIPNVKPLNRDLFRGSFMANPTLSNFVVKVDSSRRSNVSGQTTPLSSPIVVFPDSSSSSSSSTSSPDANFKNSQNKENSSNQGDNAANVTQTKVEESDKSQETNSEDKPAMPV